MNQYLLYTYMLLDMIDKDVNMTLRNPEYQLFVTSKYYKVKFFPKRSQQLWLYNIREILRSNITLFDSPFILELVLQ